MPTDQSLTWMNMVQTLSWAGAVLTAALGAVAFFLGQARSRIQREQEIAERKAANLAAARELEWRQAGAAQTSIEKLEADEAAADAMLMLDWNGRLFPTNAEKQWRLTREDVKEALRVRGKPFSEAEIYVRDAFDRLFWHFERIQSQIDVELIALQHVRFPLAYLVSRMDADRATFEAFLCGYNYSGAMTLIEGLRRIGLPSATGNVEEPDADDDDDISDDDDDDDISDSSDDTDAARANTPDASGSEFPLRSAREAQN